MNEGSEFVHVIHQVGQEELSAKKTQVHKAPDVDEHKQQGTWFAKLMMVVFDYGMPILIFSFIYQSDQVGSFDDSNPELKVGSV